MPPEGLLLPPGQRPLGLQVALLGQNQFRVKTASNSLESNLEVTSTDGLRKVLEDIKKRNPSKDAAVLDVSDPSDIRDLGSIQFLVDDIRHEGLDVHRQTVIVGWHENGAPLFSLDGRRVATIPATDAFAVGIHENRAVISDGSELVLWDVSNPTNLREAAVAFIRRYRDYIFTAKEFQIRPITGEGLYKLQPLGTRP